MTYPSATRFTSYSWWKAKLKEEDGGAEDAIGLIPCSYVEEVCVSLAELT